LRENVKMEQFARVIKRAYEQPAWKPKCVRSMFRTFMAWHCGLAGVHGVLRAWLSYEGCCGMNTTTKSRDEFMKYGRRNREAQ
jgi:hypothetical protein